MREDFWFYQSKFLSATSSRPDRIWTLFIISHYQSRGRSSPSWYKYPSIKSRDYFNLNHNILPLGEVVILTAAHRCYYGVSCPRTFDLWPAGTGNSVWSWGWTALRAPSFLLMQEQCRWHSCQLWADARVSAAVGWACLLHGRNPWQLAHTPPLRRRNHNSPILLGPPAAPSPFTLAR